MYTTEFKNLEWEGIVESDNHVSIDDNGLTILRQHLRTLNSFVALEKFRLTKLDTDKYLYEVDTKDGRDWHQVLWYDGIADKRQAKQTFSTLGDINDLSRAWTLNEFESHRPLRDHVLGLIGSWKPINVLIEWA